MGRIIKHHIQQGCKHGYRKYYEDTHYCNVNCGPTKPLNSPLQVVHILQKKENQPLNWVNCPLKPYKGHSNQKLLVPDLHSNSSASATIFISELHFISLSLHFILHYSDSFHILCHGWITQWEVNSLHFSSTASPLIADRYFLDLTEVVFTFFLQHLHQGKAVSQAIDAGQGTPGLFKTCFQLCHTTTAGIQISSALNSEFSFSACRLFSG